ncbi:unnamed protein product [Rotaria magnacalcarata]|uniref:SH3 domain-containing protein n=1 Tax=Rotaria magnacalcarata TaxID=392030 RepID=A0A816VGR1_9BILA|nr:unnamed protein product [Rotaria magnacalcarata]CAF2127202.1 unnamed protein product [Rotaria magnacalcarata]CAF4058884.1 unnamed protein product [Rotaria magnacalcarata]CAF4072617.1 unnamed protein product [Rotaria magnacalcarata]
MYESEIIEYTNRHKMEETTAKVFARLSHMKSILYKTIKKSSCGTISKHNGTYYSPTSGGYDQKSESTLTSLIDDTSEDTISSISADSMDSGVSSVLSDFSHYSLSSSSTSLLNRTATGIPKSCHLRCDPSIINYISHNLLTTHRSELFLNEIDDPNIEESPSIQIPLAESSRRIIHENEENDQTIVAEDEDEQPGPLTSTLIDRWHSVTKAYSATFRQDLTVRKNELVQVLRSTHPHWVWVRNEHSQEGFVPIDCLIAA